MASSDQERGEKKRRFWNVNPAIYDPGRPPGIAERILAGLASVAKTIGPLLLIMLYPVTMVYLGLAHGGLAFWSALTIFFLVIWLVLSKIDRSRRYDAWDFNLSRRLPALLLAFAAALGLVVGLAYYRALIIPLFLSALGAILVYRLKH